MVRWWPSDQRTWVESCVYELAGASPKRTAARPQQYWNFDWDWGRGEVTVIHIRCFDNLFLNKRLISVIEVHHFVLLHRSQNNVPFGTSEVQL